MGENRKKGKCGRRNREEDTILGGNREDQILEVKGRRENRVKQWTRVIKRQKERKQY